MKGKLNKMVYMKKISLTFFLALTVFIIGCTTETTTGSSTSDASGTLENGVRIINVNAFRFDFEPNQITANKGEKVKLIVTSTDVTHGFALPDYDINVPLPAGKQTIIEFTADKQGNFQFFCSIYCGADHSSMKGSLIVR